MPSMHIGVDIRHLATQEQTGIGRYTIEVLRELQKTDITLTLFASGKASTLRHLPALEGFTIHKQKIPNRILSSLLYTKTRTLESFLPNDIDAWWLPNRNFIHTSKPYALTVHDLSPMLLPQFFRTKDRLWERIGNTKKIIQNAAVVLAVSNTTKQDLVEELHIDTNRLFVTPLGVTSNYHRGEEPSDKNILRTYGIKQPYILHLATKEPRKNTVSVIRAFNEFKKQRKTDINLVLCGARGWKSSHLNGLRQNDIVQTGYVKEAHKPALYRNAWCSLFPSFYEGFGLPALESLACGTPVITSAQSSLPEALGGLGIYVNPFSVSDITQALVNLSRESTYAFQIAEISKHERVPSWKETAAKTRAALRSMNRI